LKSPNLLKMDQRDIQRHLAQLSRCIKKSIINRYSDSRKDEYQKKLHELYNQISKEDFSKLSPPEISNRKTIIDFIFHNIQFLDNSTLTISPFEIVYCLERVLEEWIPDAKFIVATSLSNNLNDFYFDGNLTFNTPIYDLIKNDYKVEFEFKLIQISLPRFFVHDYLANVALYHELGHFIDSYFAISKSVVHNQIIAGKLDPKYRTIAVSHHMEYFADIFAAQYVGNSLNHFINYIAYNFPNSHSHPSTDKRLVMVREFLKGNFSEPTIEALKKETLSRTKLDLIIRHTDLKTDDFENLIPMEIASLTELHSLFLAGWNFWKSNNKVISNFGIDKSYKIINNLIEKSISNFIVLENWKK
jgi:hypothetical protein